MPVCTGCVFNMSRKPRRVECTEPKLIKAYTGLGANSGPVALVIPAEQVTGCKLFVQRVEKAANNAVG